MVSMTRRALIAGAVAAPFAAKAQTWPSGTIRIVVPYPPGGSNDLIARLVQPGLQQRLGATVIVENKAGASGSIGTAVVAKSPPDGNTWLITFDNHAANPFILPALPFDTEKDLEPVLLIGTAPYVVCTHPDKSYKTIGDVIAAAKAKPSGVGYASVGSGSIGHLAMVLLSQRAGVRLIHLPYRGGGPALNDVVAGHVDLLVGSIALSMTQIEAGKLRAVTQFGANRARALSAVPTVSESFPGLEANAWWGMFAPAGTPKPIIERFSTELAGVLREERITKQLTEQQQATLLLAGPEDLRKFVREQMRVWGAVVRENGITAD